MPSDAKFDTVCVLSASIPKSFYLIQSGSNTFILDEAGDEVVITIPPGNYEQDTFLGEIQSLLNVESPNGWIYTVSVPDPKYDADTGKITYSVSGNGLDEPSLVFPDESLVHEQMGFEAGSSNIFVNDTLVSTYVSNLQRESTLYIHSTLVAQDDTDVLVEIFTGGSPDFSNITYQCTVPELYSKPMRQTGNTYEFRLCNENGNEVYLNGGDIQLTVVCYKKTKTLENIDKYITASILDHFESNKQKYEQDLKMASVRQPDEVITEDLPEVPKQPTKAAPITGGPLIKKSVKFKD
jgi:hypothetical protein